MIAKSTPGSRLLPVLGPKSTENCESSTKVVPSNSVTVVVSSVPVRMSDENFEPVPNSRLDGGLPEESWRNPGATVPREIGEPGAEIPKRSIGVRKVQKSEYWKVWRRRLSRSGSISR
jgi:hypothetical protein